MKRFLSILLTVAMVMSLCAVFFVTPASAAMLISNTCPVIYATVGDKVTFSSIWVMFDGDTTATDWGMTWYDASGAQIQAVTPTERGVTPITVSFRGQKSKTIYVVAKEKNDTEYVLFEDDMSKYNTVTQMKNAGYVPCSADSYYDLSGDTLVINRYDESSPYGFVQMLLPSWLGDFGDYKFTVEAKMLKVVDDGRWLSLTYRNSSKNGEAPYYQMCVRNNNSGGGGVEFSERNSNGWNVVRTAQGTCTTLMDKFHTFSVDAYGKTSKYAIDGKEVLAVTPDNYTSGTISPTKGSLGISVSGANLSIKKVKVTLPIRLIDNKNEENVLVNPIANVQAINGNLNVTTAPGNVMLTVSSLSDVNATLKSCIDNNILPTFYVTSNAEADKVLAAMSRYGCIDANAISPSTSVLNYIRGSNDYIRTGLDLTSSLNKTSLTSQEAHNIRVQVRSAPATFCVINTYSATTQVISELQELGLAVWVKVDSAASTNNFNIEVMKAVTGGANGVISASAPQVTSLINTHLEEDSLTRTPIVVGHRGNPTQAPENSISGFWAAYHNGADVFELDVEITSDGQIIVMHDNTINRTTNYTGTKTVNQMTLAEIKSYNILANDGTVSNEKVPTLIEVCEEFQDTDIRIFVEFKGSNSSNVPATCKILEQYGYGHKVDVISFSANFIKQTNTEFPGMSTAYLYVPTLVNGHTKENAMTSFLNNIHETQKINSALSPACTIVYGGHFNQIATDRGMTVWPWTYSGSYSNNIGFFSGSSSVTTDQVEWFKDMIKSMYAEDFSLVVGGEYAGGSATIVEYDGDETLLKARDTLVSVIAGNEYVEVVNGKLVGKKAGTATVIFGYEAISSYGSKYVVYSQPVTVNVTASDKNATLPLIKIAETINFSEYEEDTLVEIRDLYAKAKQISVDGGDASEIAEVCQKLAKAINNDCILSIQSIGKSYTRPTPDYNYYGEADRFKDDYIRLTDGIKSSSAVLSKNYSAWTAASGPVEIVIDLGDSLGTNVYNIYTCGDFWGIAAPYGFSVFGSNDGTEFTEIGFTETTVKIGKGDVVDGSTQSYLYRHTATSSTIQNYRYIKFSINIKYNFLWIDEVEALLDVGTPASENGIYINGFNSIIREGDAHIFTPDFNNGLVSATAANHRYTHNILAKWNETYGGYIVTKVSTGNGTVSDIQLASDEIFIAVHFSDYYEESKLNYKNALKITVGQELYFFGVDSDNKTLGLAPYIRGGEPTKVETPEPPVVPEFIRGDVNGKGDINATDYFLLKRIILGSSSIEDLPEQETAELRCDINKDGKINTTDYLLLKNAVFGLYEIPN